MPEVRRMTMTLPIHWVASGVREEPSPGFHSHQAFTRRRRKRLVRLPSANRHLIAVTVHQKSRYTDCRSFLWAASP